MKTAKIKKLVLKKKTISHLDKKELKSVNGGVKLTYTCISYCYCHH